MLFRILHRMKPTEAVSHLKRAGMTEKAIGSAVGANQSTVNRIGNGMLPNWELGQALVRLAELTPIDTGDQAEAA